MNLKGGRTRGIPVRTKMSKSFLPPANEVWGKVIFLHLSVILFTGGEYLGRYPPGRYTPGRSILQQVNPPAGTSPWQVHPPSRYTPQQVHPPQAYTPLRQCILGYGQQAGGTHPTGMHSCILHNFYFYILVFH